MSHSIRCHCGKVKGTLNHNQEFNRCVCYCADCQAFARFLKREPEILDEMGGTRIIQTIPANIRFTKGIENLACMRLTSLEVGAAERYSSAQMGTYLQAVLSSLSSCW
jgi:hypothetical protein